ncbi:MAG: hypothetical protein RL538_492 [Candidatus Parcubacteria bacterium]|jgi:hypothetical protein
MKEFHKLVVAELIEYGHSYFPIDTRMQANAASSAQLFLTANRKYWRDWSFPRLAGGQTGIIEEDSDLVDTTRLALCFDHEFTRQRPTVGILPHARQCLGSIADFNRHLKTRVLEIGHELDRYCATKNVAGRFKSAFEGGETCSSLFMHSALHGRRMLDEVIDDSVFTIYLGGQGGDIHLKHTGEWVFAEPPRGSALIICGARVEELGCPELRPMTHRFEHTGPSAYHSCYLTVQMAPLPVVPVLDNVVPSGAS